MVSPGYGRQRKYLGLGDIPVAAIPIKRQGALAETVAESCQHALQLFSGSLVGYIQVGPDSQVQACVPDAAELMRLIGGPALARDIRELWAHIGAEPTPHQPVIRAAPDGEVFGFAYLQGQCAGDMVAIFRVAPAAKLYDQVREIEEVNLELHAIMATPYDVIYVSDGQGNTLRASAASERLFGLCEADLVGKNVRDLEAQGIFRPSATVRVLETRIPVTVIQDTKAGRRLLVHAVPIFNEQGDMVRVINTSRDITEVNQLQQQLNETREVAARYLREAEELRRFRQESGDPRMTGLVVRSSLMQKVLDLGLQVAEVDSTVLILGESGVGKEVLAKLIHRAGPRRDRPMITINCGAIPGDLLESELFGYEKGAFTGANRDGKPGLVELASGGIIFLDEVGEMPLALQVKMLRVLQEREITRVGGLKPIAVNIRVIAATNRDLAEQVRQGRFREDLFYRLNVVPIHVPPLRERPEEIPALVHYFLERYNTRYRRQVEITSAAMEILESYHWPGNVRELENVVERITVTGNGTIVDASDLPQALRPPQQSPEGLAQSLKIMPLNQALEAVEAQIVLSAYEKYKNTYTVAEVLGINQSTVVRKLRKYQRNAPPH